MVALVEKAEGDRTTLWDATRGIEDVFSGGCICLVAGLVDDETDEARGGSH